MNLNMGLEHLSVSKIKYTHFGVIVILLFSKIKMYISVIVDP